MTEVIDAADGILFAISDFDRRIANAVLKMPAPPKWAAVNAIRHLNGAWKLREFDPAMAALRAITAEEEAASALIQSLKRRRYDGARRLKHTNHVHKHAVVPFFEAIMRVLSDYVRDEEQAQLYLDVSADPPKLLFRFRHRDPATDQIYWVYPKPPLNGSATRLVTGRPAKLEDFSAGVDAVLQRTNAKDMLAYVRERVEERNRTLYASDKGLFQISFDADKMFAFYRKHVFSILRVYLMIDPYPKKQLFVQQCLAAFLQHLNALPNE